MDGDEIRISASEFKARCLATFDRLATRKLTRVIVTKRGHPAAVLSPPPVDRPAAAALFGCLRGSVVAPKGFDFVAPVLDEPLDAEKELVSG